MRIANDMFFKSTAVCAFAATSYNPSCHCRYFHPAPLPSSLWHQGDLNLIVRAGRSEGSLGFCCGALGPCLSISMIFRFSEKNSYTAFRARFARSKPRGNELARIMITVLFHCIDHTGEGRVAETHALHERIVYCKGQRQIHH